MLTLNRKFLQNREHAAHLLALKVWNLKNTNAMVVGIGHGGSAVGSLLAKELNLSFEVVLCKEIRHPADHRKTIGSVSDGVVLMNEEIRDIPREFLVRHVHMLQNEIKHDYEFIYGNSSRPSFQYKTIIPVGDVLATPDSLMAGLKVIKSDIPQKVIVAVPVVESHAAAEIAGQVTDLVFVHMERGNLEGKDFYDHYPPVDLAEIKNSVSSVKGYETYPYRGERLIPRA